MLLQNLMNLSYCRVYFFVGELVTNERYDITLLLRFPLFHIGEEH
jgi:hypothetical protein